MTDRRQQTTNLILVTLAVVVLVLGAYLIGQSRMPRQITAPEIAFLESTEPALILTSEGMPESSQAATIVDPDVSRRRLRIIRLDDGGFMLAGWPDSFLLRDDGSQIARIEHDPVPDELFVEAGIDPEDGNRALHEDYDYVITGTGSGRTLAIFNEGDRFAPPRSEEILLVEWDINGRAISVIDLGPAIHPTSPFLTWELPSIYLSTFGDRVMVLTNDGTYVHLVPGEEPWSGKITLLANSRTTRPVLFENGFYTNDGPHVPVSRDFDGNINWDIFERMTETLHPVTFGDPNWLWQSFVMRETCITVDGNLLHPTADGVYLFDHNGNVTRRIGDISSSENLFGIMQEWNNDTFAFETDDGWLIYRTKGSGDDVMVRTDHNFSVQSNVNLSPSLELPEEEQVEIPLLEVGDQAYPPQIYRDFHSVDSGFRGINHTRKRVITTDMDMIVTSIFDRTNQPDGEDYVIHICREDSRGFRYILDQFSDVVQVFDPDGNFVRHHFMLGYDLFGTGLDPRDLYIDALDRLWMIGNDRIFVIDRDGYLVRIFEQRGADFNLVQEPDAPLPPPEEREQGYKLYASTDPFNTGSVATEPVTLSTGEYYKVTISSPDPTSPVLMYFQEDDSPTIRIFDWDGRERGTIEAGNYSDIGAVHFMIGPDGYCYMLSADDINLSILSPLGELVTKIMLDGIIRDDLEIPIEENTWEDMYIDGSGNLVITRTENSDSDLVSEVLVSPLRVETGSENPTR